MKIATQPLKAEQTQAVMETDVAARVHHVLLTGAFGPTEPEPREVVGVAGLLDAVGAILVEAGTAKYYTADAEAPTTAIVTDAAGQVILIASMNETDNSLAPLVTFLSPVDGSQRRRHYSRFDGKRCTSNTPEKVTA